MVFRDLRDDKILLYSQAGGGQRCPAVSFEVLIARLRRSSATGWGVRFDARTAALAAA